MLLPEARRELIDLGEGMWVVPSRQHVSGQSMRIGPWDPTLGSAPGKATGRSARDSKLTQELARLPPGNASCHSSPLGLTVRLIPAESARCLRAVARPPRLARVDLEPSTAVLTLPLHRLDGALHGADAEIAAVVDPTCTLLLAAGLKPHLVQRQMRQSDFGTTLRYDHTQRDEVRTAAATLPLGFEEAYPAG